MTMVKHIVGFFVGEFQSINAIELIVNRVIDRHAVVESLRVVTSHLIELG